MPPATRILALLEVLQTHPRISGAALAERLGVDRRTIRRYIARLEELGIPVTADRGPDGGYMLVAGFKLLPLLFTDDEALALSVGLLAARNLGLGGAAPAVASAQAKLERVMPARLERRVRAIDETVTLDIANDGSATNNAMLVALTAAAQTRTRVRLAYGGTLRPFDPYGVVHKRGCWYAVGWCHLRRALRSFRVDRVEEVTPLGVAFERPKQFDARAYLNESLATLPRTHTIEVRLDTTLARARRVVHPSLATLEEDGEHVVMRGTADDLAWFARELARLPFAFTIVRPAALRAELAAHAKQLLLSAQLRKEMSR